MLSAGIPPVAAQQSIGETIFVHTNTTLLLTGETLHCKLYCLNPTDKTPSSISKIAYVELVGDDRKSVSRHKVYIENGVAQSYFFIPTTLKTGNYKLVAYTQWMLNGAPTNFFATDICIVNPFQPLDKNTIRQTNQMPGQMQKTISEDMAVTTNKSTYTPREKVILEFKNLTNKDGNFSVSVRKTDGLPTKASSKAVDFVSTPLIQPSKIALLPEMRGEIVIGSIVSKKGTSVADKTVALSIPGKSFVFKLVKTDQSGRFVFMLDKYPNTSSAIVQVMEDNRNDYTVLVDEPVMADFSKLQFDSNFALSSVHKTDIETRSVAIQIENAYYDIKKDSIEKTDDTPSFFHPLEKRYVLDDYTRFPTLRETITEVVIEMFTRKSGGKSSIHLRNETMDPEVFGQPLIMVDGLLIQDTNELYDYNPENIHAIDLINYPYVYGPRTFSGVANIETKNGDYEMRPAGDSLKKLELHRPLAHKRIFSPDYTNGTNSRTPDYRYQLLWEPELTLTRKSSLQFYTSDAVGKYEIVVEGFTKDGTPVSVKEYFEVK